jgi:sugar phosphate isomerase/epimerase
MKFVMFTKLLKDLDVDQLADAIQDLGFDGFDLAVRPGFPINPENVAAALPPTAKKWGARGLTVGMVTTNFDFLDPTKPEVEPLLGACAEIGCREIKLGYWVYRGEDYWTRVEEIRKALAGFEKLCAKHNVRVSVHTHSGPDYGSNCAGVMHLVKGLDARYIGAYIDPGHLAIGGESLPMAFSMVKDYLCLIAVKSPGWFRTEEKGKVKWEHRIVPLREGIVDWKVVLEQAKLVGYDGVYTLHSEYEDVTTEEILRQTRDDLVYLKGVAAEVG